MLKQPARIKFHKSKDSKQNIKIFFDYLKKNKSPYSVILLDALRSDLSEDDFRQKIKDDVSKLIEDITSHSK